MAQLAGKREAHLRRDLNSGEYVRVSRPASSGEYGKEGRPGQAGHETHVQGRTSGLSRNQNRIDVSPQPETQVEQRRQGRSARSTTSASHADKDVGSGLAARFPQRVARTRRNAPVSFEVRSSRCCEARRVVAPRAVTGVPARRPPVDAVSRDGSRRGPDRRPTQRLLKTKRGD